MSKNKIKKIDLIGISKKVRISIKIPKEVWELAKETIGHNN